MMEEGTVGRWLKAEGDRVKTGDTIVRIETADSLVEIEASCDGVLLKVLAPEGTVLPVNTAIGILGQGGEDVSALLEKVKLEPLVPPSHIASPPQAAAVPKPSPKPAAGPAPAAAPGPAGSVIPILMPQAGQSMEEGTMVAWRVKEGDKMKVGDIIFEVETDKATIEVEAVDAGRLAKIVAREGDVVPVKVPVGYIADNDADVDAYVAAHGAGPAAEAAAAPAAPQAAGPAVAARPAAPVIEGGRVKASPAARQLAAQRGIDLAAVGAGSGPGGRILTGDVEAGAAGAPGPIRRKMSSMRKTIAKRLLYSKQNLPHFYLRLTVDAGPLFSVYQEIKAAGQFKCTVNDFVVAACARCIREFPAFRSRLEGEEIVELPSANVGVAVGTDDGLLVPVVIGADRMGFRQLAGETRRLVEAARAGKMEGAGQGVFTITNLGMFGVEEFHAIINPPEPAILAVGAIREDTIVVNGDIRPARVMTMVLSADHRVVDGLMAAKFAARLKELLESPQQLVK
jgi:pyruvate dehydrogenase E2 component (dihydrolipoamide acetyltransferase)